MVSIEREAPARPSRWPVRSVPVARPRAEPVPSAPRPVPPSTPGPMAGPEVRAAPGELTADVLADRHRVRVSLVGVVGGRPGPPYGWNDPGRTLPDASLPVVLGEWN